MNWLLYMFIVLPAVLMVAAVGCTWFTIHVTRQRRRRPATSLLIAREEPCPPFTVLSLTDAFEPETAPLWETQAAALQAVAAAGASGLALSRLKTIYAHMATRYPELYDGGSFASWLQFLEATSLVCCEDDSVRMTVSGRAFLECRVTAGVTA